MKTSKCHATTNEAQSGGETVNVIDNPVDNLADIDRKGSFTTHWDSAAHWCRSTCILQPLSGNQGVVHKAAESAGIAPAGDEQDPQHAGEKDTA